MNHQTGLDDTLANTRLELDSAQHRIRQLEALVDEHRAAIAKGDLVRRSEVDRRTETIVADLTAERNLRAKIEKSKKDIELELENLTTALFEEANEVRRDQEPFTATKLMLPRWFLPHEKRRKSQIVATSSFVHN